MSDGRLKKLVSNTALFGISTAAAKLISFLMLPVYTGILDTGQYGLADTVFHTGIFLIPVISLCVHESVIRYGMEKNFRRRDIFTTGVLVILGGLALLVILSPFLRKIELVPKPMWLIICFCLMSALRSTVTGFVRASGFTRLFALDGIVTTVLTAGLSLLFLLVFKLGVTGFVLGTVAADAFSALSMIITLRLYRFFRPGGLYRPALREMLRYCVPLVPTAIFWAVTNLSDRFFITAMVGIDATGLYGVSARIPTLITLVSTVFIQAWQISAFDGYSAKKEAARFYSTVYRCYSTLIFLAASAVILLCKPLTVFLSDPSYHESWRYVPFLLLAVGFSCLVTFLGTIYNAAKKNAMVTVTTFIGAGINILLNWLLIPDYGPTGAAFATYVSYLIVFIVRAADTRRYLRIDIQPFRLIIIVLLLLGQCYIALAEVKLWVLWEALIFLSLALLNLGNITYLVKSAMAIVFPAKKLTARD
ncbi:MAG: polysaccharide biosynthesis C-terminal domain-containing protein [Oscillospiraceae bacterium]|jgi:O-antigen/teichoic acid export membrane protein|nr:polysaccharide biosynthesis C-terminal domain-containing protein [Oscillospiraceae bacterium]